MDTKPTYTKFHDFQHGGIGYMVKHPTFTEAKLYPEVHQSDSEWVCYLPGSSEMLSSGKSRTAAVDGMLKYADNIVRGIRLRDAWYEKEQELVFSSTAWHALYSGRENADDTVNEGGVDDGTTEYWQLAWSGYESLMDELDSGSRELAKKHNLEDLPVCGWCGTHFEATNSDDTFCATCLPVATLSQRWEDLDETDQVSADAKKTAAAHADETVDDFSPKQWFEVALARYQELTGTAASVAEIAQKQVEGPDGMELFVGEDERHQVHVRIVGINVSYAWLRAAAAAKKWTGGCKVQQVTSASGPEGLRFVFRYEI